MASKLLSVPVPDYFYYFPKSNELRTVVENRTASMQSGREEIVQELYSSDGIYIWYSNVKLVKKKKMRVEYPTPFIHMNYALQCNSSYQYGKERVRFARFSSLQYNVMFLPAEQTDVEWLPAEITENFEINITREFFERQLPEDHPFIVQMRTGDQPVCMTPGNLPITPQIRSIIYEILHCTMEPVHKRLFLKAKTLELISLQLQQEAAMHAQHAMMFDNMKPADVKKMYMARDIIMQYLNKPHSLATLAHMSETNECYLKKNFKRVFGTTVFGYIQQARMERAKDILLKEKRKIGEVAKVSGYSSVSHFSKAFKKYFGFSPQKLKLWFYLCASELHTALFSELSVLAAV